MLGTEINKVYQLIADSILVVHFAFIGFVLVGQVCVVVGYFRKWQWVRNATFRVCHILAIGIVVAQAWMGQLCPLTIWENSLRQMVGEQSYTGTFVEHWVGKLVYYDVPLWCCTVAYSFFGALVLFSWFWVKPERRLPDEMKGDHTQ
jgi:hypothetical protein